MIYKVNNRHVPSGRLVNALEIGARLKVSKSTVSRWELGRTQNSFPLPALTVGTIKLYDWREVEHWHKTKDYRVALREVNRFIESLKEEAEEEA